MTSSTSRLFEVPQARPIQEQAEIARNLLEANNLYNIANSASYPEQERQSAFEKSSSMLKEILNAIPHDPSALGLMARIEIDNNQLTKAERYLCKALEFAPYNENILLNTGYLKIAQREYQQAEKIFTKVLELNTQSIQAFSAIALTKLKQKEYISAFCHYRSLLDKGIDTPELRQNIVESLEFLTSDSYQPALESTLSTIFQWDDVDHIRLSNLSTSLLSHKYDLKNEDAVIDLAKLEEDNLLCSVINKTLLNSIEMESLITEFRKSILFEVSNHSTLRDSLLPYAIAFGEYAARTDYALLVTQDEEQIVSNLTNILIEATSNFNWKNDDILGALIILSMYEPLYTQKFSFQLLRDDLDVWPEGVQSLMSASLYDLCEEHDIRLSLFGNSMDSLLNNEVNRAANRWTSLDALHQTNYYSALSHEAGLKNIPTRFKHDKLNILVLGCNSGLRAFYINAYFKNVQVTAVDSLRENITYAQLMSKKLDTPQINFICSDYFAPEFADSCYDIIEFGDDTNNVADPEALIQYWKSSLKDDGLMRFHFNKKHDNKAITMITDLVKKRGLSPTADNIRQLRNAICEEAISGHWDAIVNDKRFYTSSGCKELFFQDYNHAYDLYDIDKILKNKELEAIGFVDLPTEAKASAVTMRPEDVLSWARLDQDNTIFKDGYNLYCRKVG